MKGAKLIPGIVGALLLGCAAKSQQHNYYLLRPEFRPGITELAGSPHVVLGQISVAQYLDQAGVVVEVADGQIQAARYHLWAEPLNQGLKLLIVAKLEKELNIPINSNPADSGDRDYRINIHVDELHGTSQGEARIVAFWRVTRPDKSQRLFRFSATRALPHPGYPELIKVEKALINQLCQAISGELRPMLTTEKNNERAK
jgi:hypothetical protein